MTIVKSVGKSTAISIVGTICSYLLTMFLAREGGALAYGKYAMCFAWAAILTTIINCVSEKAFTHLVHKNGKNSQEAFNTISTVRILLLLVVSAVISTLNYLEITNVPWLTFLLIIPAFNLGMLFEFHHNNFSFAAILFFERLFLLIVNLVLLQYFAFEKIVYASYAIVTFLSLIAQSYIYKKFFSFISIAKKNKTTSYFRTYWPLLMIAMAQLGYGNFSRLIVETKLGLAVFANVTLAFQVITLGAIFQNQVDRAFRPLLVSAGINRNFCEFTPLVKKYFIATTLPLLVGAVFLYLTAPYLISLMFGSQYNLAGNVLQNISLLLVSINLIRLTDMILLSLDLIKINLYINLIFSIFTLATMYILPNSYPLAAFMWIIVIFQFLQASVGIIAARSIHKRTQYD